MLRWRGLIFFAVFVFLQVLFGRIRHLLHFSNKRSHVFYTDNLHFSYKPSHLFSTNNLRRCCIQRRHNPTHTEVDLRRCCEHNYTSPPKLSFLVPHVCVRVCLGIFERCNRVHLLENNTPGRADFPGCPWYPQHCAWTGIVLSCTKPCHFCCEPLVAGITTWSRKLDGESAVLYALCRVFQDHFILKLVHERWLHL